jgi:hypothetical protein
MIPYTADELEFLNNNKGVKDMFKFELPSYDQAKKITEQYFKDCQKFWSDFFEDAEKTLKEYYKDKK